MKKVALSAAILALAMMGCSESGMDGSVGPSTVSEFSKNNGSDEIMLLKKSGDESCFVANGSYDIGTMNLQCGGYSASFSAYRIEKHGGYNVGGTATVGKIKPSGNVDYPNTRADFSVIVVCGANCRLSGDDVVCDEVRGPYKSIGIDMPHWSVSCGTMYDGDGHGIGLYGNRISVVSNMAVIVNNGMSNSKTLTATVASGFFGNTEVAYRMAKKYIYDVYGDK